MGEIKHSRGIPQAIIDINSEDSVNSAHQRNNPWNRLILELRPPSVSSHRRTRISFQVDFRAVRAGIAIGGPFGLGIRKPTMAHRAHRAHRSHERTMAESIHTIRLQSQTIAT